MRFRGSSRDTRTRSVATFRRSGESRAAIVSSGCCPERGPFNLANLVVGSEGTLAIVVEASVRLVPQPKAVVGVAGHFETRRRRDDRR